MHYICYFVRFCFNDNKNTKLKKYKKNIEKKQKKHKNMFLNFYKKHKTCFVSSMLYIITSTHHTCILSAHCNTTASDRVYFCLFVCQYQMTCYTVACHGAGVLQTRLLLCDFCRPSETALGQLLQSMQNPTVRLIYTASSSLYFAAYTARLRVSERISFRLAVLVIFITFTVHIITHIKTITVIIHQCKEEFAYKAGRR